MAGDGNQRETKRHHYEITYTRRLTLSSQPETSPKQQQDYGCGPDRKGKVYSQIPFQRRAFELPSPRGQAGCNSKRNGNRRREKIEIGGCCEGRLFPPYRQNLEYCARDKKRDWEMDNDRVLRVRRQNGGLEIERIQGRRNRRNHERIHFSTTIVPVILG